jgi:FkbM family methyltransferase
MYKISTNMAKILKYIYRFTVQLGNLSNLNIITAGLKIFEFGIRRLFSKNFVMKDIWGVVRIYTNNDPMGLKTSTGGYELEEQAMFNKLLRGYFSGPISIVDVGSAIGTYSCLFGVVNKNAKVFSFEPNPFSFEQQVRQIRLNGIEERVQMFNLALSDKQSELSFYYQDGIEGSLWGSFHNSQEYPNILEIKIETATLDSIFDEKKPDIDIIKLDIEGAELPALRGMEETISRCQPFILCEVSLSYLIEQEGNVYLETMAFFKNLNYTAYLLNGSNIKIYEWPEERIMNLILVPDDFNINNIK